MIHIKVKAHISTRNNSKKFVNIFFRHLASSKAAKLLRLKGFAENENWATEQNLMRQKINISLKFLKIVVDVKTGRQKWVPNARIERERKLLKRYICLHWVISIVIWWHLTTNLVLIMSCYQRGKLIQTLPEKIFVEKTHENHVNILNSDKAEMPDLDR